MSQMLVGIDVSLRSHHVHFMDEEGRTLADFSISNDQEGADALIRNVLEKAEKNQLTDLKIGMEATDQFSWHIAHYLRERLGGYEPKFQSSIYVLNARKVARFKKGYDTLPKNDKIDAWVIADHLRFGRLPFAMQEAHQYEALYQHFPNSIHHLNETVVIFFSVFLDPHMN